jgi:hypothetical protein
VFKVIEMLYTSHYFEMLYTSHYFEVLYTSHYFEMLYTSHYFEMLYTSPLLRNAVHLAITSPQIHGLLFFALFVM